MKKSTFVSLTMALLALAATVCFGEETEEQRDARMARDGSVYCEKTVTIVTHPKVADEPLSAEYSVTVKGKEVPVYLAQISEHYRRSPLQMDDTYSFASFDFSGSVEVAITCPQSLRSLSVRSSGRDIPVTLQGKVATFTLEQPGNFLIERNGNGRKDPLVLFANPLEVNPSKAGDPGVIYFGPGRHDAGLISLTSNQTLYIDGGAVVTGRVVAQGDNIRILGRGLLENAGEKYFGQMILLDDCTRVRVEGIILRKQSRGWTLVVKDCDDVVVSNAKICGSFHHNDDGIDFVNTRNMLVEDCFIRTNDDSLAFKGIDDKTRSNCENITVTRTTMWSDTCCAILLGDESRAAYMRNITIKDCFVPYLSYEGYPKKFLMLHSGEDMRMENILVENIKIRGEGQNYNYIEMSCEFNVWAKLKTAGFMRNITLRNVHLTGKDGGYFIVIKGFDKTKTIEDVRFEDCTINGKPLTSGYPNLRVNEFTKNIEFHVSGAAMENRVGQ